MILRSEITKMEETLKEYQLYKTFLDKVTPQSVKDLKYPPSDRIDSALSYNSSKSSKAKSLFKQEQNNMIASKISFKGSENELIPETVDDEEEDDLELYFTDAQQLLDIFLELEEQNLSLIQNSQDTEEALEEIKQTFNKTKIRMEREIESLKGQEAQLQEEIRKEVEKEADLRIKASYFSYGKFKPEEQDQMLQELRKKVGGVYKNCIGENEANLDTLQMLTNIENKLEELFQRIEQMPAEKVEEAEKAKEKERRMKQRNERIEEQKKNQEERIRKALERARAEPKKPLGRRLMVRSKPPTKIKQDKRSNDQSNKNDEELAYFFT
jgi:hypothetical protein